MDHRASRPGHRRVAQCHVRQRRGVDHRRDGAARGTARCGEGVDHRIHHRKHPARAGTVDRLRRREVPGTAIQSNGSIAVDDVFWLSVRSRSSCRRCFIGCPRARHEFRGADAEPGDLHRAGGHLRVEPDLLAAYAQASLRGAGFGGIRARARHAACSAVARDGDSGRGYAGLSR